jgi:hypothetical protein
MLPEELARKWAAQCDRDEFIDDLAKVISGQVKVAQLQKEAVFHRICEARKMLELGPENGDGYKELSVKVSRFLKFGSKAP